MRVAFPLILSSLFFIACEPDVRMEDFPKDPALAASFCYPNDIGLSPDGKYLYINDVADTKSKGTIISPMVIRKIWINQE